MVLQVVGRQLSVIQDLQYFYRPGRVDSREVDSVSGYLIAS